MCEDLSKQTRREQKAANTRMLLTHNEKAGGEEHWEVELAQKLTSDVEKQIKNVLLRPLLKRCA